MKKQLTPVNAIKELKRKLNVKQMSALVGSGFSQNVSEIFPLWSDLLYDMAYSLHGKELEEAYNTLPARRREPLTDYLKKKINDVIERYGYLELVSEFIRRKGYVEAVTTYVEEKTPKVIQEGDAFFLVNTIKGTQNKVAFKTEMLQLHSSLLELPWNNIYTTNYDDMLERANDSSPEKVIKKEMKKVRSEIDELYKKIAKGEPRRKKLQDEVAALEQQMSDSLGSPAPHSMTALSPTTSRSFDEEAYYKIKAELTTLTSELGFYERQLKNRDKELLSMNAALEECIIPIIESSQLSVKRNKNIIKLHGSLRTKKRSYGFDNDSHRHYIIAKEDYDSYPTRHEAFTQLMRISLLQESYCLIGFSGVDPNFLEWIKWVRDILIRSADSNKTPKIFLIDVGGRAIEPDKQLFYDNFRIYRISLQDEDIKDFLIKETELSLQDRNSKKELLSLFFSYLKDDSLSTPRTFVTQLHTKRYGDSWHEMSIYPPADKVDIDRILKEYDTVMSLKDVALVKPLAYGHYHNKLSLVNCAVRLLERLDGRQEDQAKMLDLIVIAIQEMFCTVHGSLDEAEEKYILDLADNINPSAAATLRRLKLRDSLMRDDHKALGAGLKASLLDEEDAMYYRLLELAYQFRFAALKKELHLWEPKNPLGVLRRSSLMMIFNTEQAGTYLNSKKTLFDKSIVQLRLYFLESLRQINYNHTLFSSSQINEAIAKLETHGFETTAKLFDLLLDDIRPKPEKLDRYGAGRFTVSTGFRLSKGFTDHGKAIQFLNLLALFGTQMRIGNINFKSNANWYLVYQHILSNFTGPAIFYSLGYSEEKVLRRMAQDCAYSERLTVPLENILSNVLTAYLEKDTPRHYKESCLIFSIELLVAIPVRKWQSLFLKIWQSDKFTDRILTAKRDEEIAFVTEAIVYLKDLDIIRTILDFCLKNAGNTNVITLLYHFNKNYVYKTSKSLFTAEMLDRVDAIIQILPQDESLWFTLGNISRHLVSEQKQAILNKITLSLEKGISNERAWRIITYFGKGDPQVVSMIKAGIIDSDKLFFTGFAKNMKRLSMGDSHIPIHSISQGKKSFWSKNQSRFIYTRLAAEFAKIQEWNSRRTDTTFEWMLQEMFLFLQHEERKLGKEPGFDNLYKDVREMYFLHRGFDSYTEALMSDDSSIVNWALAEMSADIDLQNATDDLRTGLQILINRILLKKESSFESGVNYLASWLSDKKNTTLFKPYSELLKALLKRFREEPLDGCNIPFIIKQLISIANSLKRLGIKDESVDFWLLKNKNNRFYN